MRCECAHSVTVRYVQAPFMHAWTWAEADFPGTRETDLLRLDEVIGMYIQVAYLKHRHSSATTGVKAWSLKKEKNAAARFRTNWTVGVIWSHWLLLAWEQSSFEITIASAGFKWFFALLSNKEGQWRQGRIGLIISLSLNNRQKPVRSFQISQRLQRSQISETPTCFNPYMQSGWNARGIHKKLEMMWTY